MSRPFKINKHSLPFIQEQIDRGVILSDAYRKKHKELMQVYYTLVKLFILWKKSLEDINTIQDVVSELNINLPDIISLEELEKLKCAQKRIMNDVETVNQEIDQMFLGEDSPIREHLNGDLGEQWMRANSLEAKEQILKEFGKSIGIASDDLQAESISFINDDQVITTSDDMFLQVLRKFAGNKTLSQITQFQIESNSYSELINNANAISGSSDIFTTVGKGNFFNFRRQVKKLLDDGNTVFALHDRFNIDGTPYYKAQLYGVFLQKIMDLGQFDEGYVDGLNNDPNNEVTPRIIYLTFNPKYLIPSETCNSFTIGYFLKLICKLTNKITISTNDLYKLIGVFIGPEQLNNLGISSIEVLEIYNLANAANLSIDDNVNVDDIIYNFIEGTKFKQIKNIFQAFNDAKLQIYENDSTDLTKNDLDDLSKNALKAIQDAQISNKKFLYYLLDLFEKICSNETFFELDGLKVKNPRSNQLHSNRERRESDVSGITDPDLERFHTPLGSAKDSSSLSNNPSSTSAQLSQESNTSPPKSAQLKQQSTSRPKRTKTGNAFGLTTPAPQNTSGVVSPNQVEFRPNSSHSNGSNESHGSATPRGNLVIEGIAKGLNSRPGTTHTTTSNGSKSSKKLTNSNLNSIKNPQNAYLKKQQDNHEKAEAVRVKSSEAARLNVQNMLLTTTPTRKPGGLPPIDTTEQVQKATNNTKTTKKRGGGKRQKHTRKYISQNKKYTLRNKNY